MQESSPGCRAGAAVAAVYPGCVSPRGSAALVTSPAEHLSPTCTLCYASWSDKCTSSSKFSLWQQKVERRNPCCCRAVLLAQSQGMCPTSRLCRVSPCSMPHRCTWRRGDAIRALLTWGLPSPLGHQFEQIAGAMTVSKPSGQLLPPRMRSCRSTAVASTRG